MRTCRKSAAVLLRLLCCSKLPGQTLLRLLFCSLSCLQQDPKFLSGAGTHMSTPLASCLQGRAHTGQGRQEGACNPRKAGTHSCQTPCHTSSALLLPS